MQCARQLKIRSKVFWGVFSACSYIFFDFQDNKYTVLLKYKIITVHLCSSFRYKCLSGLYEWNSDHFVLKHAYNHCCIVSKDTGEITVEQKRINNALSENCNVIIKLVTKAANGYRNWERFRNRRMLIFKKGIDFEIDKDNGSIKIVEKKELGQLNVARAQN